MNSSVNEPLLCYYRIAAVCSVLLLHPPSVNFMRALSGDVLYLLGAKC